MELVSELLLDLVKLDIKQPVYLNYSQLDLILSLLKVVLMPLSEICTRMTGDGIFMIPSKVVIGLVTKMPFNI